MADNQDNYVVLARKYRPQNFSELLGQDALVQTITNAIKNNRLHHAYMLTGIRGVGKTTTARIIAKALNCTGKDAINGATVNPCGICENCRAIAESRHIDVLELDAASRTGVENMRELLDGVCYKPTNGRYKVYIIDEIHMLSKGAFNALLKTLEEPPSHVIFIFATTEIGKVPITVLSRCQRFDLQRLSISTLTQHFKNIIQKENYTAEDEALHLIARAADGSCRDGLSLLDQAISLGLTEIKTDIVKNMLGSTDKNILFDIFETLLNGKINDLLSYLEQHYNQGGSPISLLQDLISLTHLVAKVKVVPKFIEDDSLSENERTFCSKVSTPISIAILSKIWQMLIKGLSELSIAPSQYDALEMLLIRIAYSANLPTPSEILDGLKKNSDLSHSAANNKELFSDTLNDSSDSHISFNAPEEFADYLVSQNNLMAAYIIKHDISFSSFTFGKMAITKNDKVDKKFLLQLQDILFKATNHKWEIEVLDRPLGQTIADKENIRAQKYQKDAMELPLVKAILSEFPNAKIESLTRQDLSANETDKEDYINDYNPYTEEEN